MARVAGSFFVLHLPEKSDEALEGLFAGGLVAGYGVGGVFASAHEAVTCAIVGDGFIFFACGLHGFDGGRNGGSDAGVVASVEAIDRSVDGGYIRWAGAVEDEGSGEVFAVGGEGECFTAAPAEAGDSEFSVGGGEMLAVVGGCIEVSGDDVGVEAGDGFDGVVLAGEGVGAAAVGAEAGEQVGCDDDEALCGEFVGHFFGPVAEAEDLVDEDDYGCFPFDFGVDDEGLNGAVAVLERNVFVVAG